MYNPLFDIDLNHYKRFATEIQRAQRVKREKGVVLLFPLSPFNGGLT
jgi:hypothetical protein